MFSLLQQHILRTSYNKKSNKIDRGVFVKYYSKDSKVKINLRTKIITQSIERLIDRGLLVGYGVRTPKKWFIKEVGMTALGRRKWKEWLGRKQKKLPL